MGADGPREALAFWVLGVWFGHGRGVAALRWRCVLALPTPSPSRKREGDCSAQIRGGRLPAFAQLFDFVEQRGLAGGAVGAGVAGNVGHPGLGASARDRGCERGERLRLTPGRQGLERHGGLRSLHGYGVPYSRYRALLTARKARGPARASRVRCPKRIAPCGQRSRLRGR